MDQAYEDLLEKYNRLLEENKTTLVLIEIPLTFQKVRG